MSTTKPFVAIVAGLAIVVADFRVGALDVLFDPAGWVLVGWAALTLSLPTAAWAAGAAAALSFSDAILPFRYVYIDRISGEQVDPRTTDPAEYVEVLAFEPASGLRLAVMAAAAVAAGLALWFLLDGLAHAARTAEADRAAWHLRLLRWMVPGLWVLPYLAVVTTAVATDGSFDPVWNGNLEYVVFAELIPFAWLAALLLTETGKAWTFPAHWTQPTPWPEPAMSPSGAGHRETIPSSSTCRLVL